MKKVGAAGMVAEQTPISAGLRNTREGENNNNNIHNMRMGAGKKHILLMPKQGAESHLHSPTFAATAHLAYLSSHVL